MTFSLSRRSKNNLIGVHPTLVKVVQKAIETTEIDFGITCGLRTVEQQKKLLAKRKTTTMHSLHIPGEDGYSHAIDIVPFRGKRACWDHESFFPAIYAIGVAAKESGLTLVWGSCWTENLNDYCTSPPAIGAAKDRYQKLRESQGRKPFFDSPHIQIGGRVD